ncbi:ATP-dependent DNA helicase pif1-like [Centruroides vittatus]|uniref:ATP-dependent DNA helicase pif1-like n=1 Tax=Centruroides vittatus TaxID=120091 RepID=UPI00350F7467
MKFRFLNGEAAQRFQIEMKSLKFIIDEMSMIGARMLYMREMNLKKDEPFGGFFIYLFGDFHQLPPVKDTPLYSSVFYNVMSQQGSCLITFTFDSFEKLTVLSNSHRQNSADSSFTDVLQHLASDDFSDTDLNILMTKNGAYLSRDELDQFQTAV